jgi:hypothetical protein
MFTPEFFASAQIVAAISGLAAHQFVFIHGEWHIHTLALFNF